MIVVENPFLIALVILLMFVEYYIFMLGVEKVGSKFGFSKLIFWLIDQFKKDRSNNLKR